MDESVNQCNAPSVAKYVPSAAEEQKRDNNFVYHAPKDGQADRYGEIRMRAKLFAEFLQLNCPQSRELSVAMTKLEEVMFWANASIARNE